MTPNCIIPFPVKKLFHFYSIRDEIGDIFSYFQMVGLKYDVSIKNSSKLYKVVQ